MGAMKRKSLCAAVGSLVAGISICLLSRDATASCRQWARIHFNLRPNNPTIEPGYSVTFIGRGDYGSTVGSVTGFLHNDRIQFIVNWDNGTIGSYHGGISSDGHVFGETYDMKNPGSVAGWQSVGNMRCNIQ
jgi:hypothetical protein